jgi:hypothetical protein
MRSADDAAALDVLRGRPFRRAISGQRSPHDLIERRPRIYVVVPNDTAVQDAFSERDIEHFAAPFRRPARARAASAPYRNYITHGRAHMTGGYRRSGPRLSTPTRLLFGANDAALSRPRTRRPDGVDLAWDGHSRT